MPSSFNTAMSPGVSQPRTTAGKWASGASGKITSMTVGPLILPSVSSGLLTTWQLVAISPF
jgi:hypothetical protein